MLLYAVIASLRGLNTILHLFRIVLIFLAQSLLFTAPFQVVQLLIILSLFLTEEEGTY
jgi:hypothetical protein